MEKKIDLKPGERCPTCGQMIRKKYATSEARKKASREVGKKFGGRPIDPNSKRQIALRKKAEEKKE